MRSSLVVRYMSTITEDELRDEISSFLEKNLPQIRMHGGTSSIVDIDTESGVVVLQLGGTCSGCGLSPMTVQAIKQRMVQEMEYVSEVEVYTGMESEQPRTTDAPF